ncbi:MAG: hypothetical protein KC729_13580, partial [Candidatus Eisenbacteria bacterium]|nr:hypothetical protein [Candidatus Eisenbacteria bacterium]
MRTPTHSPRSPLAGQFRLRRPGVSAGPLGPTLLLLVALLSAAVADASASDRELSDAMALGPLATGDVNISSRITTGNNIGLTVYNDGFIGTNLANRNPSLEYPLGSNIEHLVRAGVWIGGLNARGDTLVSTSTVAGRAGSRDFTSEFVPVTGITELSLLPNSRYFSRDARSEQDFRFSFADTAAFTRDTEDHRPLDVQIDVETLLFSFEPFD